MRGRLWRTSNPHLREETRQQLVAELMDTRCAIAAAKRSRDVNAELVARTAVDAAKIALGERGPVWWDDGGPNLNRRTVRTTSYASWYAEIAAGQHDCEDGLWPPRLVVADVRHGRGFFQ